MSWDAPNYRMLGRYKANAKCENTIGISKITVSFWFVALCILRKACVSRRATGQDGAVPLFHVSSSEVFSLHARWKTAHSGVQAGWSSRSQTIPTLRHAAIDYRRQIINVQPLSYNLFIIQSNSNVACPFLKRKKKNAYYLTHITLFGLYKVSDRVINQNKSIKRS